MIRRACFVVVALLTVAGPLGADQHAYIVHDDALRALEILDAGPPVRLYCVPCGDEAWTEVEVGSVEASATGYKHYWQVSVNGQDIDLAYTYVVHDDRWQNLAAVLGLEVWDVPLVLGDEPAARVPTPLPAAPPAGLDSLEDELDAVLFELRSQLGTRRGALLDAAQTAWLAFRDAQAALEAAHLEGTDSYAGALDTSHSRLTRDRIGELDRLLVRR